MSVNPSADNPRDTESDSHAGHQATLHPGPSIVVSGSQDPDYKVENVQINIKASDARAINPGGDPTLGIPDRRMVSFHISTGATVQQCPFWIGIASQGEIQPPSLLNHIAMEDLFSEAAVRGISDSDSVMLTDTLTQPPRYIFLMPRPGHDFRETSSWIASLVSTVRAWSPTIAGFYLAPEVLVAQEAHDILSKVLRELISTMPNITAFHLLVGRHSFNGVLNMALRLKSDLEGDDLNVFVYH
ncbi:hypothetical protein EBZ80_05795 [bacterium]|nr:hypothetical protein [bacterium]